ncbi:MAG: GTPase HflX [Candidatus Omnitrophota bacterium]|nr:GTPase HflX [Candidatus Omnitrophota bacterium]MDZ4242145.1 GTPase HflX [Candidatus Omnitrophota bacterium]
MNLTINSKEKVLLAVVEYKRNGGLWTIEDTAREMEELVLACHGEVVDKVFCRIDKPSATSLIGEGKVNEIAALAAAKGVDTVVFSHELKGSQQRNLEEIIKAKTIDRTQLILDIFARRASSQEGRMQVELAQLEYLLPRLVGKGIALSRLGGGIGTVGPGETKLEVDRRRIGERVAKLKDDLKDVALARATKRKKRKDQGIPLISLVGYTNAGKSTLLNTLTQAEQVTKDGLFTTLDSVSRQFSLPNHQKMVLSDTVGFIHELPHNLIEAFKATLEEVVESDLLMHVVDVSHPKFRNLYDSVVSVLGQLDVAEKTVITVLNKIDRLEDKSSLPELEKMFPNSVSISALKGERLAELLEKIGEMTASLILDVQVTLPIMRMDLINLAHKEGQVFSVKYYNDKIFLHAALPHQLAGKFLKSSL